MLKKINSKKKQILCVFFGLLLAVALLVFLPKWIKNQEPVKIGLSTTLTGPYSTTGTHFRNGAMLAVEELNNAGGINGHPVELIIRDDKANPEVALKVDQELIDEGVVAILGHYISTICVEVVPFINKKNIVMLSSPGTGLLTGKDDNFIRTLIPGSRQTPIIADLVYNRLKLRKMAVIYDISNPKYTVSIFDNFKADFNKLGGTVIGISFNPKKKFSAVDIANEIIKSKADGVFLVTTTLHGALIAQHLKKKGSVVKIFASEWTFADLDFVRNGGKAVEGVLSYGTFNANSTNENFVNFKKKIENRFREEVSLAYQLTYDTSQILFQALRKTLDPTKIKQSILDQRVYEGIDGKIIFDKYGDPSRNQYLMDVKNGKIETIEVFEPTK